MQETVANKDKLATNKTKETYILPVLKADRQKSNFLLHSSVLQFRPPDNLTSFSICSSVS